MNRWQEFAQGVREAALARGDQPPPDREIYQGIGVALVTLVAWALLLAVW